MPEAAELFDNAVVRRCEALQIRPETPGDAEFLIQLFIACAPLAGVLPEPLLRQQALIQQSAHRAEFPTAMRRIFLFDDTPVARFVVDWDCAGSSHAIDLAVMPAAQRAGLGSSLLLAWTEVADTLGKPSTLEVLADNPARRIYDRLGFRPSSTTDPHSPKLEMERRPAARTCRSGPAA